MSDFRDIYDIFLGFIIDFDIFSDVETETKNGHNIIWKEI